MNVGFAAWVASRAARGDWVDVMFHEAFQGFGGRPRHYLMAAVQRLMAFILLRSADRVWVSTPTWAEALRPYAPRGKRIDWLPIPSNVPSRPPAPDAVPAFTVGHFGTYGPQTVPLLGPVLEGILTTLPDATFRLIGANSDRYLKEFSAAHPTLAPRVSATGAIPLEAVADELHRCAVMVQPVVNGVTVRSGALMACLANGRPVVATTGVLTHPLLAAGVHLVREEPSEVAAAVSDLRSAPSRGAALGTAGLRLYDEAFGLKRVVAAVGGAG
jgi:glycosyltransferase involved in cell wall biosynthesis